MRIISFSGIDGSGKSTQIELLEILLKSKKIKYKKIWARGSWTPGIELVKKIVRRDKGFSEEEKQKYRINARSNKKTQKIILILSILDLIWFFGIYYRLLSLFKKILICDRYIWDTLVDFRVNFRYYHFEKWFIWQFLIKFIPKPNPSFLLLLSADQSIIRGLNKNEAFMEDISIKKEKVFEYENLMFENKWSNIIDSSLDSNTIHEIIRSELKI